MSLHDILYDAILASGLEGLKRKPTLVIHFLMALVLADVGIIISKLILTGLLGCTLCFPNYPLLLVLTLTPVLISLGWYATFWYRLEELMYELLPQALESVLKDYYSFSQKIVNSTLYDLIDKEKLKKATPSIITLILSYYIAWIFSLYSFDIVLYVLSNGRYTIWGYLTQRTHMLLVLFSLAILILILGLIIRPWPSNQEYQDKAKTKGNTDTLQYLYSILRRFRSYRGLGISSKISSRWYGKIVISCLENLVSLPSMMTPKGLMITDFHQVPYTSDIEKKIREMLRKDTTSDYILEPLEGRCKDPPKAEVPLLSKACWYRVKRIVQKHGIEKEAEVIGYTMMLILTKKEERIDPEIFRDCLKKIRENVRRNCQNIAQQLIKDFKKLYLEREEIILLLLLGNEKLLGLKITLS